MLRDIPIVSARRGRLPAGAAETFLGVLESQFIRLDVDPLQAETLRIARAHRLTVYDALSLELALRLCVPLLTLDSRLAEAARKAGATTLG